MMGGRSILSQTFWLMVGSLIVIQIVITASLFLLSPPRQDGVPLVQIVDRLRGQTRDYRRPTLLLPVDHLKTPPSTERGLVSNAALTAELAHRLGLDRKDVRLFFRPNQGGSFLRWQAKPDDGIVRWRGEPIFFDRALVAARIGPDWRMIKTPDRPLIAEWQKRLALLFGLSLLALLPLVWLFARRLVKPIRAFANAADRVGHDASAPMVAEDGPAELRVAARAVNVMQGRIAEQMREREAMVAAIAHDLRTPLSRIAFRIEAADDALREPIQRDIEQMKAMITTTLSFVRGSSQDRRQDVVELSALLDEIMANEQHVGRAVRWHGLSKPVCPVRGDPVALGRMVQNLIDNAIAYGQQADLTLSHDGTLARVTVADRGPGLPAESIETMFAPFARHERSRNRETGGVGLGLAIARSIARDHGGDVQLAPRASGGLEAVITLPMVSMPG